MKRGLVSKVVVAAIFVLALASSQAKASDWWYDNAIATWNEMVNDYNTANDYYGQGDTQDGDQYATAVIGDVNSIEWYAHFACDPNQTDTSERVNECNYIWYTLYVNAIPYRDWAYGHLRG